MRGHKRGITSMSFSLDGKILATASKDFTVRLWSVEGNLYWSHQSLVPYFSR
ncbi:MAG: hypothetical protein F6J90_31250 [Moorea sp. SIOASIH]|nr:hypothetical protein [Moorena sp. SIOASIH]